MIHIEGMGWLGSAIAFRLDSIGVPFTWHDIDSPTQAWQACTGLVHPAGDMRSLRNLSLWETVRHVFPAGTIEPAVYAHANLHPPHGSRHSYRADLGWVRLADAPCWAVDVPRIVWTARERFEHQRLGSAPADAHVIVAHGDTDRRGEWVWGWSADVVLSLPPDLADAAGNTAVALYGRAHRFSLTYAHPAPGHPPSGSHRFYRVGSALMNQTRPKILDVEAHLEAWVHHAARLFPEVSLRSMGHRWHGWRPKPRPRDDGRPRLEERRLVMPPLWHSGVRWAPTLMHAAADWAVRALDAPHTLAGVR